MTVQRMDNVGIVVSDLDAAVAFFTELGLELEGKAQTEGPWVDQCVGLEGVVCDVAMMRTPDGSGRFELAQYQSPVAQPGPHNPPHNIVGMHRVMFTVDDIDEVLTRLRPHGGEVVGTVVQFQDTYKLCYVRGPEGIILGLAQQLT
ncbi:VOC family protein [Kribbella albertanoniae]|uniref:VOC family protein n=1 Tax=Kribbella albertanoniae TaxID=1266829 RepID=A0A4R4PHE0_9ACTN|nr:VOC family protein [Kribbella albertanoniae]